MKVTAFVGSARKKHTYQTTEKFLQKLQSKGKIEYEIVPLSDYNLQTCRGCKTCMDKGEDLCPLKDDRDVLISKMCKSEGVIFATPNYSFQVSAYMKIFLDRLGFFCHRPEFFGKTFTCIVAQGIYGGDKIVDYLNFVGDSLGFNVVKGSCIQSLEPLTEKGEKRIDQIIDKQSQKFYTKLVKKEYPSPTFMKLMIFRVSRSSLKLMLDDSWKDYRYYQEKGWFTSEYFYPVKLDPLKKISGAFFDGMGVRMAKNN